jgi:hypothetical protein
MRALWKLFKFLFVDEYDEEEEEEQELERQEEKETGYD